MTQFTYRFVCLFVCIFANVLSSELKQHPFHKQTINCKITKHGNNRQNKER